MWLDEQKFSIFKGDDSRGLLLLPNQEQHCHVPQDTTDVASAGSVKRCGLSIPVPLFPRRKRSGPRTKKSEATMSAMATTIASITQELSSAICAPPKRKRAPSNKSKHMKEDGKSTPKANPNAEPFCRNNLYPALMGLKASEPQFVLKKALTMSDLKKDQNRLQITRSDYNDRFLHSRLLTDDEHQQVLDGGLVVTALDWKGNNYKLLLRYLDSIGTYWIRADWGCFLQMHDLDEKKNVGDIIELWAFRSPEWCNQLGFILFHYDKDGNAEGEGVAATAASGNVVTVCGEAATEDNVTTCREVHGVMVLMSLRHEN